MTIYNSKLNITSTAIKDWAWGLLLAYSFLINLAMCLICIKINNEVSEEMPLLPTATFNTTICRLCLIQFIPFPKPQNYNNTFNLK